MGCVQIWAGFIYKLGLDMGWVQIWAGYIYKLGLDMGKS